MNRLYLGHNTRVGAELGLDRYQGELVTIMVQPDSKWRLEMSSTQARKLARQLKKMADVLDPPKRRA